MTAARLKAVLVGAGKVGLGYADDPVMGCHYRYASHAQVLSAHERFDWVAVVDPSEEALTVARRRWSIPVAVPDLASLPADCRLDVAVIATPPETRVGILDHIPGIRGALVEKPLGRTFAEAAAFLDSCARSGLAVQVNLWRRADTLTRRLAGGLLRELVGDIQAVLGVYGNGLVNNGTHMVDLVRMLAGEVVGAGACGRAEFGKAGPIHKDLQVPFSLRFRSGASALFAPVDFQKYRENGIDIWGERGRLSILQEGLLVQHYPFTHNRAMEGEREIASDRPTTLPPTVSDALYHMYTNLADALESEAPLWSSGASALTTASLVDTVYRDATRT